MEVTSFAFGEFRICQKKNSAELQRAAKNNSEGVSIFAVACFGTTLMIPGLL